MDENVDKLARTQHGLTDQQKRDIAITDYKQLASCQFCFRTPEKSTGQKASLEPPEIPIISIGTQVYLGLPSTEPLVPGHCLIIPTQHTVSTLTCEDDAWTEIRNFMKCLIHAFDARDEGAVFMETVTDVSGRKGRHTAIECIPVPRDLYADLPAYFKEGLLDADDEWTQHRKIIDTTINTSSPSAEDTGRSGLTRRTGGFRRSMTAKVPYFHLWTDLDGGMGHVIENNQLFPHYFGKQIIAGMLDLPPKSYRKPAWVPSNPSLERRRVREFKERTNWAKFDWTQLLDK
ncbi:Pre-mRNA-splicing factor cwf19 [Dimargaris cristalligena]|nr:Pre-mRNA-splicing factor cwf19 [Dimargaris cristalligena]